MFRIAGNLQINVGALAREGKRWVVAGKTGEGKSNTLLVLAREMILAGWAVAVIDPMNNFRKLRDSGLPVIVAGPRKSADVPLSNTAALADFSFRQRASVVLDTSMVEKNESMDLVQAFLQRLWDMVLAQDEDGPFTPYALFIDEAQLYLPQTGITPVTNLLNDLAKRGRQLHLSMVVSSQRLTSIQKDTVLMAHVRITHKIANIDVDNFATEFGLKPRDAKVMMRKFVKGQAVVVADSDIADMGEEDYLVCQIDEFGGAATPHANLDMTSAPRIDLEALRESLGKPPEDKGAMDALRERNETIRKLRAENLRLEMEAKKQPKVEVKPIEVSVLKDEHVQQLRQMAEQFLAQGQLQVEQGQSLIGMGQEILMQLGKAQARKTFAEAPREPEPKASAFDPNGKGPRKILLALAKVYPAKVTVAQVAGLSDYTASGGAFNTNYGGLKRNGYLVENSGLVLLTELGFSVLGRPVPVEPKSTDEILEMWHHALPARTWEVFSVLLDAYPQWVTKEDVAAGSNYTASGGAFSDQIKLLKNNGLIVVEGQRVRASDTLFIDAERVVR